MTLESVEDQDQTVSPDLQDLKEPLASEDLKDNQVVTDNQVSQARRVKQASVVNLDPRENAVCPEAQAVTDNQAPRESEEPLDSQDLKVNLDNPETEVLMDNLERRANADPQDKLVPLGRLVHQETMVCQVPQASRDQQDNPAQLEREVFPDNREKLDLADPTEIRDHRVNQDLRVTVEKEDLRAHRDNQDLKDNLDNLELQENGEHQERQDCQALLALTANLER